jgi:hypothetical protein
MAARRVLGVTGCSALDCCAETTEPIEPMASRQALATQGRSTFKRAEHTWRALGVPKRGY